LSKTAFLAAASAVGFFALPSHTLAASAAGSPDVYPEPESPFSAAEREAFRQDVEHLQQNFYQASPEMRRRWIESVRERRQRLDLQEDRSALPQSRIRASGATAPELPRASVTRTQARERLAD
jgi:hypothetical protein